MSPTVRRTSILIKPDPRRVLLRPFYPSSDAHARRVLDRVLQLSDAEIDSCIERLSAEFEGRHQEPRDFVAQRIEQLRSKLGIEQPLGEARALVLVSCFTQEYACESTALFNPSMVWHPDQAGLQTEERRFLLSLRAIGEGHVSSIAFRSGVVDAHGGIALEPTHRWVRAGQPVEVRRGDDCDEYGPTPPDYEVLYSGNGPLSERILFPSSVREKNGMEDARFVRLRDDNDVGCYYATYTAYDGNNTAPQLLATDDFRRFRIHTLYGRAASNKGLALFPRKIGGRYAMLGRQDHENVSLMFSNSLFHWDHSQPLLQPQFPWELIQLGNCGSPIETDVGWLVLTHGVGAMRKYCIGAALLDRDDPSRVIGRLPEPLLSAENDERNGYVPNVVYSCGALAHGNLLIIPYAMSDYASSIATVDLGELLAALTGPHARA